MESNELLELANRLTGFAEDDDFIITYAKFDEAADEWSLCVKRQKKTEEVAHADGE